MPTPLAFGSVGLFIDEQYNYRVIKKTANNEFHALWIEISFVMEKNIICAIMYRQHNNPESAGKYSATGKQLCIVADYNLDLLKTESSKYSHDFLMCLQSCYLIPTIDKPTRVRQNSVTLIDNIFVNNPEQVSVSGNIVSDISDHFLQFSVLKCTPELPKPFSYFSPIPKETPLYTQIVYYDPSTNKHKQLECREFVKYLGVLIDYKLSWNDHIDTILLKISRAVGLLSKLRHFVPFRTLISIYHSLIAPYLRYGLIAWGQASKSHVNHN